MDYKMIVLDLDGTLTNSKKEMTPRTRDTLLKAEQQGVRIVLASGRPTYGITALAEELDLKTYQGFILAFNGTKDLSLPSTVDASPTAPRARWSLTNP